eukprot:7223872-Pyramimonas_sp.AAC.2
MGRVHDGLKSLQAACRDRARVPSRRCECEAQRPAAPSGTAAPPSRMRCNVHIPRSGTIVIAPQRE